MEKKWHIMHPDAGMVRELSGRLHCHSTTAAVLINRNLTTHQSALDFLTTSLSAIRSPFALKDMDAALNRIYRAIMEKEKILIFGDYDVDGVTATALLFDFFQNIGADVSCYIPHRIKEGYSLHPGQISNHAVPGGIRLIITADCGSGSMDAIMAARKSGIDVIVTDHHTLSESVPPAEAVINPKRPDCMAGMESLAGVGVAFTLIIALRKYLRDQNFWQDRPEPNLKELCDLVALGTIGDMVPLVEENRIFSKAGLAVIGTKARPGIQALCEVAGISGRWASAEDLAFKLVPRINAAGRMDHAVLALNLLTTDNITKAMKLADTLNELNHQRKQIERSTLDGIMADLQDHPEGLKSRSIVRWQPNWHPGILGIVASRIVDACCRPAILIAVDGDLGKGSARSIPGLDIFQALHACRHCLEDFGGHSMAAGLVIKTENLIEFQHIFEKTVARLFQVEEFTPTLSIDAELHFDDISEQLLNEIEMLSPFGQNNPEPIFMTRRIKVVSSQMVGKNHRKMLLRQDPDRTGKPISAICFNAEDKLLNETAFARMAFKLRWNRWTNSKTIQMIIEDAQ
jgi:single-stranded-DNA-specific exonuclease